MLNISFIKTLLILLKENDQSLCLQTRVLCRAVLGAQQYSSNHIEVQRPIVIGLRMSGAESVLIILS